MTIPDAADNMPHTQDVVRSQQCAWWEVHEHVQPVIDRADSPPMIGTPEWCALRNDDPRKVAAIYDAAQHWALRLDTAQAELAAVSRDISGAEDWSDIAREVTRRQGVYIRRAVA